MCNHVDPSFDTYVSELRIRSSGQYILPHSKTTVRIKDTSFRVDVGVGGVVALRKSMLITVKVEIGGATAQIELTRGTRLTRDTLSLSLSLSPLSS